MDFQRRNLKLQEYIYKWIQNVILIVASSYCNKTIVYLRENRQSDYHFRETDKTSDELTRLLRLAGWSPCWYFYVGSLIKAALNDGEKVRLFSIELWIQWPWIFHPLVFQERLIPDNIWPKERVIIPGRVIRRAIHWIRLRDRFCCVFGQKKNYSISMTERKYRACVFRREPDEAWSTKFSPDRTARYGGKI